VGLGLVLDAIQACHHLGSEGQVGVTRRVRRAELDALKQQLTAVQTTVDRLQAIIDGARAKQKLRNAPSPSPSTQS
jgi:hypothetical protein